MGIFNQNGQTFFYNFALTTHQNTLTTGWIEGKNDGNQNHFSLLSVNDPNVFFGSVKPSEEGIDNGSITRFWNFNAKSANSIPKLSKPINSAWQITHILKLMNIK